MISVLILTKNEEKDLPKCLKSVAWCDDVHVFDSFSTDRTVEIALAAGATVTQRKFDGYASQRNAALQLNFKYSWVFILDADERIPQALVEEIRSVIVNVQDDVGAFRIRRRDFLNQTWLKYSQISPHYIRLVRIGKVRYHREINEVLEVEDKIIDLIGYFDHFPFSKGYDHWINKHNQYSLMEAKRWVEEQENSAFRVKDAFFNKDFNQRRFHQKGLFYKMPFRPLLKWLYMVFVRRAFLDGYEGLRYATLQSIYEYMIVLKAKELINKNV